MGRKVVLDCDPGIDDSVALALALFDPRLEVLAVTACAGTVDALQSTRNLQSIVERLDPPRMPRLGAATDPEHGAAVGNGTILHGEDGLGNAHWEPASRQHVMLSEKLLSDQLRANPGEVTVICTGPLTNVSRALKRDPTLASLIDRLIIAGGSVTGVGDVTAAAEFNMHFDPVSAQAVFQSATTISLIPLEVSNRLTFGWELVDQLPEKYTRVGSVLQAVVPHFFRANRQHLGQESVALQAVLPILMLVEPMLLEFEEMAGGVETVGELTRGMTVFDRRTSRQGRSNMEVACQIDIDAARDAFYNTLKFAARE